jgi:4-amino-4-deoxy-L-arabinose transferase-like glycosyltransferase
MAKTTAKIIDAEPEHITEQKIQKRFPWHRLVLAGIVLISVFMEFFQLGQNGFGTFYYAAGVRSMLDSWHNFFFVSFDPGGFVSIDKPPLAFWLEVASAKLFGFTPFSVFLPQALAAVLSVIVLYYLVRRHFGVAAGLLAALALAISPISVVTARYHTIDSTLALTLLLGAWAVLRAAETGKLRWLLLCAVIVGLGFNIKMLEAYLVVPAFGLLYLLAAPKSVWKRIGNLTLAGILLLVVSFSWAVAIDITPPSQRPYVGSSQDNSELSLALGYNGIDRLLGRAFGRGFRPNAQGQPNTRGGNGGTTTGTPPSPTPSPTGTNRNPGQRRPGGGGGGNFGNGGTGPLRLFNEPLGGQIAWLLPLAILGALALAWQRRPRPQEDRQQSKEPLRGRFAWLSPPAILGALALTWQRRPRLQEDRQQQSLVLWGMWLLTMGIFFSVAGFFQAYYMTEMAPAIAALFGIGIVIMWQDYRRPGWRGWLLPLALIATVAEQIHLLASYPAWGQVLIPSMVVLCIIAVVVLVSARIAPRLKVRAPSIRFLPLALGIGVLALTLAPTVWAAIPVIQNTTAEVATAGPIQRGNGFGGNFGGNATVDPALIRYLEANQGTTKFLVAVPSSMTADGIILATNKPVMAMGGFSGGDPILTTGQLASLVANGTVRFFLLGGGFGFGRQLPAQILNRIPQQYRNRLRGGFGGFGGGQQGALTTWVTQHCKTVPANLWQSAPAASGVGGGFGGVGQLYDCATAH